MAHDLSTLRLLATLVVTGLGSSCNLNKVKLKYIIETFY